MKVDIKKTSQTKRELEVSIPAEEMEKYILKAAKILSSNMNIKGFRPGHVPVEIVENTVGKEALWEEAAKEAAKESYPQIVKENDLFAVSQPSIEIISSSPEKGVFYKAELYIMPEVNLPEYKKIAEETTKKERKEVKAEEKEIEEVITRIRESRAKIKRVQREANKGDSVTINFKGSFDGDSEKKIEEKDFRVVLGKGELDFFKGFEENIIGMKESEKKEFSMDIPDQGKKSKVSFEVEMVSVMERELPEVNDELASSLPNIESLEQLKDKIKEGIEADKKVKEEEKIKIKVMEAIKKKVSFEVPEILIEKETENMLNNFKHQVSQSGVSFDQYLKETKKTEEALKKEWKKKAEENVSYAIILHKIGTEEGVEVTDEEIEKEVDKHFAISGKDKRSEKEENLERMRSYIYDVIKNQKIFNSILTNK